MGFQFHDWPDLPIDYDCLSEVLLLPFPRVEQVATAVECLVLENQLDIVLRGNLGKVCWLFWVDYHHTEDACIYVQSGDSNGVIMDPRGRLFC